MTAPIIAPELRLRAISTASGELEWYRARAEAVLAWARAHRITDPASLALAIEKLGEIAVAGREAEAKRKEWVEAPNRWVKAVNDGVRWVMAPLTEAEGLLKPGVAVWQRAERDRAAAEQRRRDEEQRRQREEAERARLAALEADRLAATAARAVNDAVTLPEFYERAQEAEQAQSVARTAAETATHAQDAIQPIQPVAPPSATVRVGDTAATLRMNWTFEVTNLAEVPRAFLELDPEKVRTAIRDSIRATQKPPSIPGLRIYQEPDVAVTVTR